MNPELQKVIQDIKDLNDEIYKNNFSASQDFTKKSRFINRLRVPVYSADPTTGEVGELICVAGKLKICSSANTFTIVGTQS